MIFILVLLQSTNLVLMFGWSKVSIRYFVLNILESVQKAHKKSQKHHSILHF